MGRNMLEMLRHGKDLQKPTTPQGDTTMTAKLKDSEGKLVCTFHIESIKADRSKLCQAFAAYPQAVTLSYQRYDYTASDVYSGRNGTLRITA